MKKFYFAFAVFVVLTCVIYNTNQDVSLDIQTSEILVTDVYLDTSFNILHANENIEISSCGYSYDDSSSYIQVKYFLDKDSLNFYLQTDSSLLGADDAGGGMESENIVIPSSY